MFVSQSPALSIELHAGPGRTGMFSYVFSAPGLLRVAERLSQDASVGGREGLIVELP